MAQVSGDDQPDNKKPKAKQQKKKAKQEKFQRTSGRHQGGLATVGTRTHGA